MFGLLLLALAIGELYVTVLVAGQVGVLNTIALLILVSMVGVALVKRAGLGVLRRAQVTLAEGGAPHKEMVDGLILLAAGVLLFVPGFLTAAIGVLLLLPPVRALIRARMVRSFRDRASFAVRVVDGFGRRVDIGGSGDLRDVTGRDTTQPPGPPRRPPELEG